MVGTHVVSDVMKFSPRELEEEPEDVPKGELFGEASIEGADRALPFPPSQAAKPSLRAIGCLANTQHGTGWGWRQVVILVCSTWLQSGARETAAAK